MADEQDIFDEFDDLEDYETLPCSWNYVAVCILMPLLNGQLHALLFPAYTLHFEEMGWPLVRAGLAVTIGFLLSVLVQQVVVRNGYWLIVPLTMIHLGFAILSFIYTSSEWAIFAQIVCVFGIDPTCAIEGIAFDSFGASEVQAKQASSTALSVYTMAVALSCTIGGIVYDTMGWKGVSAYHSACQALLVLSLCIHPACRRSFMEVFFTAPEDQTQADKEEKSAGAETGFVTIVPQTNPAMNVPGAVEEELEVEEVEDIEKGNLEESVNETPTREARLSRASRGTVRTNMTHKTQQTQQTQRTGHTARTAHTARTVLSAFSRVTALSEAGRDFQHHFGTSNALQPQIARSTGAKAVILDALPEAQGVNESEKTGGLGIPKDVRFPAFLIVLNAAYNNAAYVIEYATFAIFFKQVHHWDEATLASVAQTAGDVLAAIAVQVIPALMGDSEDGLEDLEGCWGKLRWFWHRMMSKPYNISFSLVTWVIFNLGMMSPSLPMALVAQVFMGTTFVYNSKWTTEMNLFYSLGDSKVFLSFQVMCRNAEAIGGGLGGLLATWLYTLDPLAPFTFTTTLAVVAFVVYTAGFCLRLGFGDDIETAEAKRARRKGIRRVSTWKSEAQKSTAWEVEP